MTTDFTLHARLKADCIWLGDLPLCRVLLAGDARFAWFILVPKRSDIREAYQLSQSEQDILSRESAAFSRAIMERFNGDKLNIGALGNMVPQLHIHHIIRHEGDAAWPHAVWGYGEAQRYSAQAIEDMRGAISALGLKGYVAAA